MSTKTRKKVSCNCKICNGKLVEERTRKKHAELESHLASNISGFEPANNLIISNTSISSPKALDQHDAMELMDIDDPMIESSSRKDANLIEQKESRNSSDNDNYESAFVDFITQKKRKRQDQFRKTDELVNRHGEISSDDENSGESVKDESEDDMLIEDDRLLSDDEILVEQFNAPDFDSKTEYFNTDINFADSWILIWIFKYQARFRLSDVAIDSLIKFFQRVLKDAHLNRFKDFPSSSYTSRKLLQISKRSKTYAVCTECNTLYNTSDVVAEEGFKCKHVEFPQTKRKPCEAELTVHVPIANEIKRRPKLLFLLPNLKIQINSLYQRSEFKQQLRKWTNRVVDSDMLADIYDGRIWKDFPNISNVPYFTPETADSHLGIMMNLDWFQPFDSSVYSCGAIYGVICNLPREIRFKKENMLILGLLPGPNEVKLHKINHFLSPIVDELLEF